MLVTKQVVDQVSQGVVGRIPRKADHLHDQVVLLQESVEFIEQLLKKTFLCQFLLECPYHFLVGHLVAAGKSEEIAERELYGYD